MAMAYLPYVTVKHKIVWVFIFGREVNPRSSYSIQDPSLIARFAKLYAVAYWWSTSVCTDVKLLPNISYISAKALQIPAQFSLCQEMKQLITLLVMLLHLRSLHLLWKQLYRGMDACLYKIVLIG